MELDSLCLTTQCINGAYYRPYLLGVDFSIIYQEAILLLFIYGTRTYKHPIIIRYKNWKWFGRYLKYFAKFYIWRGQSVFKEFFTKKENSRISHAYLGMLKLVLIIPVFFLICAPGVGLNMLGKEGLGMRLKGSQYYFTILTPGLSLITNL